MISFCVSFILLFFLMILLLNHRIIYVIFYAVFEFMLFIERGEILINIIWCVKVFGYRMRLCLTQNPEWHLKYNLFFDIIE